MMTSVKLVDINIEGDKHLHRIVPLLEVEAPDIVLMQEVFEHNIPALRSTHDYAFHFAIMSTDIDTTHHQEIKRGLLVMWDKKFEVHGVEAVQYYAHPKSHQHTQEKRGPNERDRILLTLKISYMGQLFRFATTHFIWTPNGSEDELQRSTYPRLESVLAKYNDEYGLVLAGDFNAPRGGRIFGSLAQQYQDNIPKELMTTIDQELHRVKGIELVVDGLFTSSHFTVADIEVRNNISDHMAIIAMISRH